MWMMTPRGFYSAVAHRDEPDQMLIRARSRRDLVNLVGLAGNLHQPIGVITASMDADYPWRVTCTRLVWQVLIMVMADEIDYPNFKSAVAKTNEDRADTYHRVWAALMAIEHEPDADVPAHATQCDNPRPHDPHGICAGRTHPAP